MLVAQIVDFAHPAHQVVVVVPQLRQHVERIHIVRVVVGDALLAGTRPGAAGLLMLPFFNGERTPNLPDGRGSLFGMTATNLTPANLYRAAMEGATYSLRYGYDAFVGAGMHFDRIALTGAMDIPQDEWVHRAIAAGLEVGQVTKKCALLVATNPDSMSGKAQKARKYGIPIVGETTFAQLLSTIDHNSVTEESSEQSSEQVEDNTEYEAPEQFSWLSPEHVRTTGTSTSRVAAAWIALHPTKPLHEMADNLQPHHVPEATGRGIDRYLAVWSLEHPKMLHASADDLLDLPGVGPKRRSQLVEMVVDLAADGAPDDVAATGPAFTQPSPESQQRSAPSAPEPASPAQAHTDPTPEELLAAANAPRYTPVPVHSSGHAPVPTDPEPLPVKRPRAGKVFKWSALIGVACFFLFGLCLETFDPDAESFIAGVFVMGVLLSGLTAAISGVMALINLIRGK